MRLLLLLLIFGDSQASERLARVIDADGFTNVRAGQGFSFDIVDRVTTQDFFYCETCVNSDWCRVRLFKWRAGDQVTGYIHKSRIQIIEDLNNKEQKGIILSVLNRQKLLADKFVESHMKYDKESKKWNSKADSILYRTTVGDLEVHSETAYSAILQFLPRTFCNTRDQQIIDNLFSTIWSDRRSASEEPSFAVGECFACAAQLLSDQIRALQNKEQKKLIIADIEWGLLNKFSVDEKKDSSDPNFLKLKEQLNLVRD